MIKYIEIKPATQKGKKLQAIFYDSNKKKIQTIPFGSAGMSDYTLHKDPKRKERYLDRHRKRENWNDPTSAGALSRWLLWNKPSYRDSVKDFKSRFKL